MSGPKRKLGLALSLAGLCALLHLLGGREGTAVLAGMPPITAAPSGLAAPVAAGYIVAWFGAVIVAPILALAALFEAVLRPRP